MERTNQTENTSEHGLGGETDRFGLEERRSRGTGESSKGQWHKASAYMDPKMHGVATT